MGQAATISTAATEIDGVARAIAGAVPDHWRGPAARAYQREASLISAALSRYGDRVHALAVAVHAHEREAAAIRSALAAGGSVAV